MSLPISNDLRQRIVDRYFSTHESYDTVAEHFQVGRATVNRVIQRFRQTGSVEPSGHAGGRQPWIKEQELPRLRQLVAEMPDSTLDELTAEWARRFGVALSRSSMVRALAKAAISLKKSPSERPSRSDRRWKPSYKRSGTKRRRSRSKG